MLEDEVFLGVVAIVLGVGAGFVLFVPFVAISYRRRGTLTLGRAALWAAALVYFWAIWTYTLLPLPDPETMRCVGSNLNPLAFLDDVRGALERAGGQTVRALVDPATLQVLLNVVLFVPLGFFVRVLGGRGVAVAGAAGLALSSFIETTQLTGVWGLYPCAYRVFDVDDILTNTLGALLGSLVALAVPRRHRGSGSADDADLPRPVTKRRRLLAMVSDWLGFILVSGAVALVVRLWSVYVLGGDATAPATTLTTVAGPAAAAALWLVLVLSTGCTVGDLTVRVRYAGGSQPVWLARLLRYLGGIGGYALLTLLPAPWFDLATVYLVLAVVMALSTRRGRGLPGVLSDQELTDAREHAPAAGPPAQVPDDESTSAEERR